MNPKIKKNYRVVCLGNVLVDILVKPVDALPPVGGLLSVNHVEMAMGGCASNTAVALSRLGVSTSLWGKLGRDFFSDFALKELKRAGVETSGLALDPKADTSATVVLVNRKAQRSFLHSVAANDHIYKKELKLSQLSRFRHLHIGGYFLFPALDGRPMADILKQTQQKGLTTSMDTAWDLKGRWMKALKPCLPYLNYFMPSEREVKMLLGYIEPAKAAKAFLKLGAGAVIIKQGEKGSYFLNREGLEIQVPAYRTKVVDTTGAGDCFCAGFIKGLSLGWDIKKSLQLGNAAGACAVEALGATAGIHSLKQVSKFL
ncbi:MAG TPA: carbohydrate kinase family protein [bacterium]|nr:carbohydrate kinase family protein [bacterium]